MKEVWVMRKTKRTISAIAVVLALVLVGGWAFAHGSWGKRGYGYPGSCFGDDPNLSPEQREKLRIQEEKFYQDTAELRRDLYQKRLDLQGLWADPKSDPEKIRAQQREIFDLQRQIREKALDQRLATREILPQEYFAQGPRGYGHHMGYGHQMGYGPRHGWGHMGRGPGVSAYGGPEGSPCW